MSRLALAGPDQVAAADLRRRVVAQVDRDAPVLIDVSHRLHARPEMAFDEMHAAALLSSVLARRGLRVERAVAGLPTAFAGRAGHPRLGPEVIVCCEYDALPGMGHACGHNVVAAAGVGAGLALVGVANAAGGRLTVLGTPAEEGGGGKILLARAGLFRDGVAAIMVHPSGHETATPTVNAMVGLEFSMRGRAAHASMAPEQGINALDAIVLGLVGVSALRQHLRTGDRVHGVITDGGGAPNIVPERAQARILVRSTTTRALGALRQRVVACFEAGARATGATLSVRRFLPKYAEMRSNAALARCYERNLRRAGRRPAPPDPAAASRAGSTDMGNVSLLLPALQPMLAISTPDVMPHSAAFARAARSAAADRAVLDGAKAMALTALDVWLDPLLRRGIRAEFEGTTRS